MSQRLSLIKLADQLRTEADAYKYLEICAGVIVRRARIADRSALRTSSSRLTARLARRGPAQRRSGESGSAPTAASSSRC